MVQSGVYEIVNRRTDERYLGSTKDFKKRRANHWFHLRKGDSANTLLQKAWDFWGEDNFVFRIVEPCGPEREALAEREQFYLDAGSSEYNTHKSARHNYNPEKDEKNPRPKAIHKISKTMTDRRLQSMERIKAEGWVNPLIGRKIGDKTRKLDWEQRRARGWVSPVRGTKRPWAKEVLLKMSKEFRAKFTDEEWVIYCKIRGDRSRGTKWITNGTSNKRIKDGVIPEGWKFGRTNGQKPPPLIDIP